MRAALVAAGATEATIAAEIARLPVVADDFVELDADDEGKAAALFLALGGSWHRAGMDGERVGLMMSEIAPTAALYDIALTSAMMPDLRTMEAEALRVFASQRKSA